MRRLSFLSAFSVFVAASSLRAELIVERSLIDLGEIRGGQRVSARFDYVNGGSEPIELLDLERSCGCVEPRWDRRRLGPGERGSMTLELRTLGQAEGQRTWPAQIVYRDGAVLRKAPIGIAGMLKHDVAVQPAHLSMTVRTELTQEIVVHDRRETPLRVLAVKTDLPGVRVATRDEGGGKTRILVKASADALPNERLTGRATVLTNDPTYDRLEIPLTVVRSREATVAADPEACLIRLSAEDMPASATVRLRSRTGAKLVVAALRTSDPALKATWGPTPNGGAIIRFEAARPMTATVQIEFQDSGELLTIPVEVRSGT